MKKALNIEFLLTSKSCVSRSGLDYTFKDRPFGLYSNRPFHTDKSIEGVDLAVLIDGFVLPRKKFYKKYSNVNPLQLIIDLYKIYKQRLIRFVKGNFIIVIVDNDRFLIFTDHLGIKKVFASVKNGHFLISNKIKWILKNTAVDIDRNSLALFALMNQFIGGRTFAHNVNYSMPASQFTYDGALHLETYWNCADLLKLSPNKITYEEFALEFGQITQTYINYFRPAKIGMTLTGGLDSRTILAALLNSGASFSAFSYGNPYSSDGVYAEQTAAQCKLQYRNHYKKDPSAAWFDRLSHEIIDIGDSLCHIHRAHRLDAIKKEIQSAPETEMIFGGYMGGEAIRGLYYDNLIFNEIARNYQLRTPNRFDLVKLRLTQNFIIKGGVSPDDIAGLIQGQPYFADGKLQNEFFFLWLQEATSHYAQDLNLMGRFVDYQIAIFMDIDFLQMLYASDYSFLQRKQSGTPTFSKLWSGQELNCKIISILAADIANLQFAKKGFYSAKELLGNRPLYLAKRALRFLIRQKYPVNFALDHWMTNFVSIKLDSLDTISWLQEVFDIRKMKAAFQTDHHQTTEGYWRKFTNVINLDLIGRHYLDRTEN